MIEGMEEVKFEMVDTTVTNTTDDQMTSTVAPSHQQMSPTNKMNPTTSINKTSSEVRLTDEEFMEVIRDFPGVYDKNHEDFRDKAKKEVCWEKISDVLNVRIEDTKRRYETIRTRLSRHLKRIKEGYWSIDSKDMKLDFLNWLVPYIKTRDAPFQFKQHENGGDGSATKREYSMSFDDEHESGDPTQHYVNHHRNHHQHHRDEDHDDVTRVSMITIGAGSNEGGGSKTDSSNSNHEDEQNNSNLPLAASITSVTPGGEYTVVERQSPIHMRQNVVHRNNKRKMVDNSPGVSSNNNGGYPTVQIQQPPSGVTPPNAATHYKHYFFEKHHQQQQQRRLSSTSPPSSSSHHPHQHQQHHQSHNQPPQTQTSILHSNIVPGAIVSKNGVRDPKQQKHQQQQQQELLDEDEHYCMSLVGRMRKLDSKKKAYLRSTVEKLFLDFELGYVQFPKQSSYPAPPSQ